MQLLSRRDPAWDLLMLGFGSLNLKMQPVAPELGRPAIAYTIYRGPLRACWKHRRFPLLFRVQGDGRVEHMVGESVCSEPYSPTLPN